MNKKVLVVGGLLVAGIGFVIFGRGGDAEQYFCKIVVIGTREVIPPEQSLVRVVPKTEVFTGKKALPTGVTFSMNPKGGLLLKNDSPEDLAIQEDSNPLTCRGEGSKGKPIKIVRANGSLDIPTPNKAWRILGFKSD